MLIEDINRGDTVYFNGSVGSVEFQVEGFATVSDINNVQGTIVVLRLVHERAFLKSGAYRFSTVAMHASVLDSKAATPIDNANEIRIIGGPDMKVQGPSF